jgi:hypothetical protein
VQLTEYAVGKYGDIFSDNTGRLLKKGTKLRFDMHYFATGSEQTQSHDDRLQVLSEGFRPEVSGALDSDPEYSQRRAGDSAELGGADGRLLPPDARTRASTPSSPTCTCAAKA